MQSLRILFIDLLEDLGTTVVPPGVPIPRLICPGSDGVADEGALGMMPDEGPGDEVECVDSVG